MERVTHQLVEHLQEVTEDQAEVVEQALTIRHILVAQELIIKVMEEVHLQEEAVFIVQAEVVEQVKLEATPLQQTVL